MWEQIFWIAVIVTLCILESMTLNLVAVWFALGSVGGLIAASSGAHHWVQFLVFLSVSGASLASVRPFARRFVRVGRVSTNADRNIDKTGVVIERIDNTEGRGAVVVDGKTWTARSFSGIPIEENTHVLVLQIEGVKLIVQSLQEAKLNVDETIKEREMIL